MTVEKRQKIEEELAQARKCLQHYEQLILQLEKLLGKKPRTRLGRKGQPDPNLPRTSMGFWLGLIGKRPKTSVQILEAAVKKLGIDEISDDNLATLRMRWRVAATSLVKEGSVQAMGQRGKRIFRLSSEQKTL